MSFFKEFDKKKTKNLHKVSLGMVFRNKIVSKTTCYYKLILFFIARLQQKNVLDRLRLIRALFPGIIISPPSSFKGISRSGLGNSTTSGCCEKTKQAFYGSFTCKEFTHSVCDSRVS